MNKQTAMKEIITKEGHKKLTWKSSNMKGKTMGQSPKTSTMNNEITNFNLSRTLEEILSREHSWILSQRAVRQRNSFTPFS